MREILFRGKSVEENNMVVGSYWKGLNNKHFIRTIENRHFTDYEVIPETVSQYTGLTDKNGKQIFEGDILNIEMNDWWWGNKNEWKPINWNNKLIRNSNIVTNNGNEWLLKVKVVLSHRQERESYCRLAYYLTSHDDYTYRFVIVGNIWDNPELMEK